MQFSHTHTHTHTHSLATALTHANVLLRKLGASDTNGLSARSTGAGRPTAPAPPPPSLAGAAANLTRHSSSRSTSPLQLPRQLSSDSSGGQAHGPLGYSYKSLEAPDPALLPSLLCVAMERLAQVVSSHLGLEEGKGGRSRSPERAGQGRKQGVNAPEVRGGRVRSMSTS